MTLHIVKPSHEVKRTALNRQDCKKDLALKVHESTVTSILLKLKKFGKTRTLLAGQSDSAPYILCAQGRKSQKVNCHCTPPILAVWQSDHMKVHLIVKSSPKGL